MILAYAVKANHMIDVKSISPRPVAAMVNWLVTERNVLATAGVSDEAIREYFARFPEASVVEVSIEEIVRQ